MSPDGLRILEVAPYLSVEMGGSARMVRWTANCLAVRGHSVTVIASDYGAWDAGDSIPGVTTRRFRTRLSTAGFYVTPGMVPWLRAHAGEYDVLHLHTFRTFQNIVARRAAIRAKVPYVVSAHGTLPIVGGRAAGKAAFDICFRRPLLSNAARWIAVSPMEECQYRDAGIPDSKIRLVWNGLDLSEFEAPPRRGAYRRRIPGMAGDRKLIVYLGRLHAVKGLDILLRAFSRLAARMDGLHLALIGPDDGQRSHLERLAGTLGVGGRVRFEGPLFGSDRLEALADADVVALPSVYEVFGLTPLEAILCGSPMVVSRQAGVAAFLEPAQAAYLPADADPRSWEASLHAALTAGDANREMIARGTALIRNRLSRVEFGEQMESVLVESMRSR